MTISTPTRRKAVGSFAAGALALGLVACSSGNGDADGSTDGDGGADVDDSQSVGAMDDYGIGTTFVATEDLQFSVLYRDHPGYPLDEDWLFFEHLEQNHNVAFDLVSAPLSDWDDRKGLLIGAGDAPEIITVTYPGQEVQFVAGGALLPVSDYLDYLPNFTDKVEQWGLQADIDNLRQEDGKFYLLPGLRETIRPQYSFAVRSDIWEELGLSFEPADFDEFRDDLRTVKEAYPDVYPLSDRWELDATLNFAAPSFGTSAGWGFGEGVWWTGEEYVFTGATDEYRDLVTYFASLVEEGLLDPESLTQDDEQAIQKLGSEQSLAIGANDQEILNYRTTFDELGTDADVAMIRVPSGPAGDVYPAGSRLQSGLMISTSAADSDHFMAMLQFIDWLYYSDEGLEFAKWGVEGETFDWDGETRVIADHIDINGLNPDADETLNGDYGFHNGVWMLEHGSTTELDLSMLRPEVVDFVESMTTKEELELAPAWPLDELEREQASLWQTALSDTVSQATAQFILGQRSLDDWDTYVAELQGNNMDAYIDVVNEAQQRHAENVG